MREDCNDDINFHYVLILHFICTEVVIWVMDWGHVCAYITVDINIAVAVFVALEIDAFLLCLTMDSHLLHRKVSGSPARSRDLHSMLLMGSFQLEIF